MKNLRNISVVKLYRELSSIGIDKFTPEKERKYILLGNSINLTTLTLIVPYTFLFYFLGVEKLALLLGSFFFLFSFYHFLTYKRYYFLSRALMLISMNTILGIYAIVLGRDSGLHFLYFVFFTLPFLLFSLRNYILVSFCCVSSFVFFCLVRFQVFEPVVIMNSFALQLISAVMVAVTFGWLLLNKLYLLRVNRIVEADLKETNRTLQSRNSDLEQFAYVASHDLQEPLRTIASYVELLEVKYSENFDADGKQYMRYVVQSTHRLKKLIKDLLEYSRIGSSYRSERIDMNQLADEVLADLGQLIAESNAKVNLEPLPKIQGSTTDLKLLLLNLVSNAIKFRKENASPVVHITAHRNNGFWKFSVTDNGIGIEPRFLQRIFIIFQRLHNQNEFEGTGIGLSHCKKIVEIHGGTIWAESEYGKGSTFNFTIPA